MRTVYVEDLCCNFCGEKKPRWVYYAVAFRLDMSKPGSSISMSFDQDWLACNECAFLIDLDSRVSLTERARKAIPAENQLPEEMMAAIHIGFLKARTGEYRKLY